MKIKDSTFFGLLIASFFLIVILHISIKNLLKEPIFRSATTFLQKLMPAALLGQPNVTPPQQPQQVQAAQIPLSDSKQELMDYIKSNINQINGGNDLIVKSANYYSPFHQSDIHSQDTDLSKYFQINQPTAEVSSLSKQMQCNGNTCKDTSKGGIDKLTGNPLFYDQGSNGLLTLKPDIWSYDNERPMNGGMFDGIRGQDSLQSDFAIYSPVGQSQGAPQGYQNTYPYVQSSGDW